MKKQTWFIIFGIIGVIVLAMIITNINREEEIIEEYPMEYELTTNFYNINVAMLEDLFEQTGTSLIYIGRPTCPFCLELEPTIKRVAAAEGIDTFYLNLDEMTEADHERFMQINQFLASGEWGTPFLFVVDNGTILEPMQMGLIDEDGYREFLRNVGKL